MNDGTDYSKSPAPRPPVACVRALPAVALVVLAACGGPALTSSNEERDIIASYQLGGNSFVRKPIEFHELQTVVKEIGVDWLLVNQPPILE